MTPPMLNDKLPLHGDVGVNPFDFNLGPWSEGSWFASRIDDDVLQKLQNGPQTAHYILPVVVFDRASNGPSTGAWQREPLCATNVEFTKKWTLTAADQPTVASVIDPSLRAAVRASILPQNKPTIYRFKQGDETRAFLEFDHYPPIDCMFDVFLRSGSREWKAGRLQYCAAEGLVHLAMLTGVDGDRVDLILRPTAQAAAETLGITRIWGEEVVIPNVKVVDDPK